MQRTQAKRLERRRVQDETDRRNALAVEALRNNTDALAARFAEYLQTMPTTVLAAALTTGPVFNPIDVMRREMASRGVDGEAQWIGFDAAAKAWGIR